MAKRTRKTRESEDRAKQWTPPNQLDAPTPPDGFKFRWVRRELLGDAEDGNVYRRLREGYEVVMASDCADFVVDSVREGRYTGVIRTGDLILMKIPIEMAEQRNAHFERKARLMQQAVDMELDKEGSESMPIERDNKSTVTRGSPRSKNSDFDD